MNISIHTIRLLQDLAGAIFSDRFIEKENKENRGTYKQIRAILK